MSEIPTPPESTHQETETNYQKYIKGKMENLKNNPETQAVYSWFTERVSALPEMKTEEAPLTDGEQWTHTKTETSEIQRISSKFFSIEGRSIQTPSFSWNQPGIIAEETPINLPAEQNVEEMDVSGFVGVIRDSEGNVLLTVGQEPLAQTPKKALVRTPFQTSAAKLQGIIDGNFALDQNLATLLQKVGNEKPIADMFTSGDIETFPLSPADPNRIQATNMGFSLTIADQTVRDSLVNDGKNRWCSLAEAKALSRAGVVNGHTASALFTTL